MQWQSIKGTKILTAHDPEQSMEAIRCAAAILQTGGVVAFPTETVYGLGADASNVAAVEKIFAAKGRPADNPLIVHFGGMEQLGTLVREIPPRAYLLAGHFWPGPLTMVLPKSESLPGIVTAGLHSVAVRIPAHPLALALLREASLPVAAPSANLSGSPSPTTAAHVIADLAGRIDAILDGGACSIGVESTVLSLLEGTPAILRPGGVTWEMLRAVLGEEIVDLSDSNGEFKGTPPAPGMKYRHYAPTVPLYLVEGGRGGGELIVSLLADLRRQMMRPGLLLSAETAQHFSSYENIPLEVLGSRKHPALMASRLYAALRRLDDGAVDIILAEGFAEAEMGRVLMNRLRKAASRVFTPSPALCVLFICSGNTCRSVMAEAFFRRQWERERLSCEAQPGSAGLTTVDGLSPSGEALTILREEGLSMGDHRSRLLDREQVEKAHYIFTMTELHKRQILERFPGCAHKVWMLGEFAGMNIEIADPYGHGMEAYRLAAAQLKRVLAGVAARLKMEIQTAEN
jgi:L-threonylcarbamoyladenylate synthase